MRRIASIFILLIVSSSSFSQINYQKEYFQADSLLKANDIQKAYTIFKGLKPIIEKTDTLYRYVVWYYLGIATELEKDFRLKEDFTTALKYAQEALALIQENKEFYDASFGDREAWMIKNITVSYFGLDQIKEAKVHRDNLYKRHKEGTLPSGIKDYFNFDFFTLEGKNIWGYEWFAEMPNDRFSESFTKIVYYVYSTNPDGSDKDQLFRFHVLMFHQDAQDAKFDYILERQQETETATVSGSYYKYLYSKDIDYVKLRSDIKTVILTKLEPDSRSSIPKKK